jgi:Tfp pilus assembly pilus retraction ATPase PilT
MVRNIMSEKVVKAFEEEGEADFSYAVSEVGRFQVTHSGSAA